MTTPLQTTNNNSIFRSSLEKEKLTGPNSLDWYRNLRIVLKAEKKLVYLEQPIPPIPTPVAPAEIVPADNLEDSNSNDMLKELKTMFSQQVEHELLEIVKALHDCKQEEGRMGKTIAELHAMLKLHEKGIRKKDVAAPVVLTIRTASLCPQTKDPPPLNNEHPAKDVICHHYGEVGQWMRNSPAYLSELMKKKNKTSCASSSCIFFIELYSFPSKSWVYVTGYGTHICNTNQGLQGSMKLKIRVLNV
ncbi:hypothetical protein Tco_0859823 [Tanacetum coccineum]|uniref:Zinc finger, CCHC-type n=1 Tax=Tanacetum coccineum TaxID=301880 RepID=A0ABQ5BGP6_9ASTR